MLPINTLDVVTHSELRAALTGLNSFPVTPFGSDGSVDLDRYATHVEHQVSHGAATIFPAAGTGEYAALGADDYAATVEQAVHVVEGRLPVVGAVGVNAATARDQLGVLERTGCAGALVLPPYLAPGDDAGLEGHYRSIATASELPVIVYVRPEAALSADAVMRLTELPNVVGVKDGTGAAERLTRLAGSPAFSSGSSSGDAPGRVVLLNGMPTAELSAGVFTALGATGYSSAVYNFVPDLAVAFRQALADDDALRRDLLLDAFYRPFGRLRDRRRGYAVSLVKAGVSAQLGSVGDPRPPLPPVDPQTDRDLRALVDSARAAVEAAGA